MDDRGAEETHVQQPLSELTEQAVDWLDQLGLRDKVLHLVADDSLNHHEATFWLRREDGTKLPFRTLPGSRAPDPEWVSEVEARRFAVIFIGLGGCWYQSLVVHYSANCRDRYCREAPKHTEGEHSVLHELLHVASPEFAADNDWTDAKVAELLSAWRAWRWLARCGTRPPLA